MVILWIIKNVYLNPGSPVVKTLTHPPLGVQVQSLVGEVSRAALHYQKKKFTYIAYIYFLIFLFFPSTHCFYFYPTVSKQHKEHNIQQLQTGFSHTREE